MTVRDMLCEALRSIKRPDAAQMLEHWTAEDWAEQGCEPGRTPADVLNALATRYDGVTHPARALFLLPFLWGPALYQPSTSLSFWGTVHVELKKRIPGYNAERELARIPRSPIEFMHVVPPVWLEPMYIPSTSATVYDNE
jgi:hypothetical protein